MDKCHTLAHKDRIMDHLDIARKLRSETTTLQRSPSKQLLKMWDDLEQWIELADMAVADAEEKIEQLVKGQREIYIAGYIEGVYCIHDANPSPAAAAAWNEYESSNV